MKAETRIVYDAPLHVRYSHGLPHWEVDGGVYFITFRLFDSLPRSVTTRAFTKMRTLVRRHRSMGLGELPMSRTLRDCFLEEVEASLERQHGQCWLQRPEIARLICEAFEFYDQDKYDLLTYVVMGNHVHLVFKLYLGRELGDVIGRIESYTARHANLILDRTGQPFWKRGYYDHLVRTVEECQRVVTYVWNNPEKAGLKNWKWRRRYPERTRCFL